MFGLAVDLIFIPVISSLLLFDYQQIDPPAGYYQSVDTSDASELRQTLHDTINDHIRYPYTSTATDTWDILEQADEDSSNADNIVDIYMNASYPKAGGGNSNYQREHVWPSSYGFAQGGYPYTDCHQLHLSDGTYNNAKGNRLFGNCSSSCAQYPTEQSNGVGGNSGVYPSESNWGSGVGVSGIWETWQGRRGDVARTMFYLDVRYEGGFHTQTRIAEPDLILTDDVSLIEAHSSNRTVAYMGFLSVLLRWHAEDPVDYGERYRNQVVYSYQGNRNPFVDHPEWVRCLYGGDCLSTEEETTVWINEFHYDNSGSDRNEFVEVAGKAGLNLAGWSLVGYNGNNGLPYKTIELFGVLDSQIGCMGTATFLFPGLQNGPADGLALVSPALRVVQFLSYEGTLVAHAGPAQDLVAVEVPVSENGQTGAHQSLQLTGLGADYDDFSWIGSPQSGTAGLPNSDQEFNACEGTTLGLPWINEIHYDNAGLDREEGLEIAGPETMNLDAWHLVAYNGRTGQVYLSLDLSGFGVNRMHGAGFVWVPISGLQNGAPDAIALVDALGQVVEFLSYEGTLTAVDGPARQLTSVDIGVSENASSRLGTSLQRVGQGRQGQDFGWSDSQTHTRGELNRGQVWISWE